MNREALKFTDLDAFLRLMEQQGFGQQAREVIYERDELPYCSAYLIPTDLLPPSFDYEQTDQFGGTLTQIQPINFMGTEVFYTDFMVYPRSLTGYVEAVDKELSVSFAAEKSQRGSMIYVINMEDGGGEEFYMTVGGKMVSLRTREAGEPQEFKTYKLMAKKIDQIRPDYSKVCRLYGLDRTEFDKRRAILQAPPADTEPGSDKD